MMIRLMNWQPGRSRVNSARKQQGLTLIELMIALTLGMLLLGGIIAILMGSRQTYRVNEAMSRMQDNARYAFQVLSRDIRGAGYFGCIGSDVVPTNTLNGATATDIFLYKSFGTAIQGYEASAPAIITDALGGTDSVAIRGVEGNGAKVTSHATSVADLNVGKPSGLLVGDVVLVSDCLAAAIFQVSGIGGGLFDVVQHTGGAAPGNATNDLGKVYTGGEVLRIATHVYYLRTNPDGRPALYRKVGAAAAEEVVEGVENMQIQYGVDTNGDLTPDVYGKADSADLATAADWSKVVSARVSLLMQTIDNNVASQPQPYTYNGATPTPTDRRLRQVYSTVIALRNRAP